MTIEEKLTAIAENQERVFDAGKAQRDYEWWDRYQTEWHGTGYARDRIRWLYAFAGHGWDDTLYNPIRQINADDHSQSMYAFSAITDTKVPVRVTGTKTSNRGQTFRDSSLVTVRKFIVDENTSMSAQFTNCTALQNLTIEGTIAKNAYFQWCPLTPESMISVITHLKNFTGTGSEYSTTLQFSDDCWNALEAHSTAPDGGTWRDYVYYTLCWNT